jgi:hypothetical protein
MNEMIIPWRNQLEDIGETCYADDDEDHHEPTIPGGTGAWGTARIMGAEDQSMRRMNT